jgi:hypothetical protein
MTANWTAFVAGDVLTAAQLNGVVDNFADIAIFNETQANGTNGGATVANAWTKRTLNTTNVNNIAGASIATSVITLPAGTFKVNASAPFYAGSGPLDGSKLRLQNTTAATTEIIGQSMYLGLVAQTASITLGGVFTLATSSNLELQYYVKSVQGNGLGQSSSTGVSEVYANIEITRIA